MKSNPLISVQVDLPELKQLAFANIRSKLTPANIYAELFSRFTSLYPEILDMQIKYIVDNWEACEAQQDDMLRRCMEGEFPYGAQAMSALFKALRPTPSAPPAPEPPRVQPQQHPRLLAGQTLTDRLTRALPGMRPRPHRGPLQRPTAPQRRAGQFGPYSTPSVPAPGSEPRTGSTATGPSTSNSARARSYGGWGDVSSIAARMQVDEDSDGDEDPMWSRFDIGGWN